MKIFTVLYPNIEKDANVVPVMVELSQDHISAIHKGQKTARQLKGVIDIILRLSEPEFLRPKITFFEKGFNEDSWTKYESMFAKIDDNGNISIGVSYIELYGSIEQRFVYNSAYDISEYFNPSADYLVGDDFLGDYLQDADNLLEMKKIIPQQDYEFLVKESGMSDEELQEAM